jgi:DOPA 4,5-dioxygenase
MATIIINVQSVPTTSRQPELLEYHFHVYWQEEGEGVNNGSCNGEVEVESYAQAKALYDELASLDTAGHFVCKVNVLNRVPVGPHTVPSFQAWVPIEYFSIVYDYFMTEVVERYPALSVFIHPLSVRERFDHSHRGIFIGSKRFTLNMDILEETLDKIPLMYPELGLGYSRLPASIN